MKHKGTLRIELVSIHLEDNARAVPLGAAAVASALKKNLPGRVDAALTDLYLKTPAEECIDAIMKRNPDCVGFSVYLWNHRKSVRLAAELKKRFPSLIIFAGGPEVSAIPEAFGTGEEGPFDFIVTGEGEEAISGAAGMLLEGKTPSQSAVRAPLKLETLPSPYLDGTIDPARYSGLVWELSRGCPFRCDFCFESRGFKSVRLFPAERIEAELHLFAESGVRELFILDPTFNHNRKRAKEMLRLFKTVGPDIHYNLEIRSEYLDPEMAALFGEISCSLQIGLQSAHPEILENINRSLDREDFQSKVLFLHEEEVVYGFDLIYGLPGDSFDGFLGSLDFAFSMVPNHLDIFLLAVLPGTRLHDTAAGLGLDFDREDPYLVRSSPGFPAADLARAGKIAGAVNLFYNEGRAVPWFSIILENLGMEASRFFRKAAKKRETAALAEASREEEIPFERLLAYQQSMVSSFFTKAGKEGAALAAADLIGYFGALELLEESGEEQLTRRFSYSPAELVGSLENGYQDLEELSRLLARQERDVTFTMTGEGIIYE